MAPRKPKITLADVQAWCNKNGYWLLRQPSVVVGTVQFQVYKEAQGELVAVLKQTHGTEIIVKEE